MPSRTVDTTAPSRFPAIPGGISDQNIGRGRWLKPALAAGLCLAFAPAVYAGGEGKLSIPAAVPAASGSTSPWAISIGVRARQLTGDFTMSALPPAGFSLNGNHSSRSGRGDVGFFKGKDGTVTYDDGKIGPSYGFDGEFAEDGTAYGKINSASQLSATGRSGEENDFGATYDLTFHSSSTRRSSASGYSGRGFGSSDEAVAASPFLELRRSLMGGGQWSIGVMAGYSWAAAELGSGTGGLGSAFNRSAGERESFSYTYDHHTFPGDFEGATFPYEDENALTVFDAETANSDTGFTGEAKNSRAPRKSTHRVPVGKQQDQRYQATGHADLDVNLHELVLAPELTWHLNERLHLLVSAGPTVNFINADLEARGEWKSGGRTLATVSGHDSASSVEVGVMGQLALQYDLTSQWFVEANASYRYVPEVDLDAGLARASVDASTWSGGVAVGFRF